MRHQVGLVKNIYSRYQYCPLVWYVCSQSDVLVFEWIQKRILRMVLENYESSYEELLSKCGMNTLEIQRARPLVVEVYKSIHQMTPMYIQEMINIKVTPCDPRDPCRTVMQRHMVLNPLHMRKSHLKLFASTY